MAIGRPGRWRRHNGIAAITLRYLLILCVGMRIGLPSRAALAVPALPADDAVVLEQVPDSRDKSSLELRRMNVMLAQNRHDPALAVQVARLDLAQSRKLGDPRFLGRAEAAMAPWPAGALQTPPDMLLLYGVIEQSNHDFGASIATLQRVLAAKPDMAQAWLTLAAVHQAQADYAPALRDCGQVATGTLGLIPDICTASVMALIGHAPVALRAIAISLDRNAAEARAEPSVAVWALSLAAETAERIGDSHAEQYYRQALAVDGDDPYLLGAWSDWLLDQGRPREVVALLAGRTRIDPLLLRLALAEQVTGDPLLAQHVNELEQRFEASRLRGDTVHRREEARYELALRHQPEVALALARANWDVQREPADARILLEAASAAHHPDASEPVRAWLRDNHVQALRLTALAAQSASVTIEGKS